MYRWSCMGTGPAGGERSGCLPTCLPAVVCVCVCARAVNEKRRDAMKISFPANGPRHTQEGPGQGGGPGAGHNTMASFYFSQIATHVASPMGFSPLVWLRCCLLKFPFSPMQRSVSGPGQKENESGPASFDLIDGKGLLVWTWRIGLLFPHLNGDVVDSDLTLEENRKRGVTVLCSLFGAWFAWAEPCLCKCREVPGF